MVIGICDNNTDWYNQAKAVIEEYGEETGQEIEILHFSTGQEVKNYQGRPIHVMFVEIELEEENGIDLAKWVNQAWEFCQIVYVSNDISHTVDVYQTEHIFFLIKEQFAKRIGNVFEKIHKFQERRKQKIIFNVTGNEKHLILEPEEILYFERTGRVTHLETVWGQYLLREKLDEIMKRLPELEFVRCHNSYIVYFPAAKIYETEKFVMRNEVEIMISRSHQKSVRQAFLRWVWGTQTRKETTE